MSSLAGAASENTLDLEGYFARIGYRGDLAPTIETLHALHFAHATSIPFENLDVLLGRPISLNLQDIQKKLVRDGRGGYCFEQNRLLGAVLESIGFRVTGLAGRVRKGSAAIRPRTHMILQVDVDNEQWLVDVGFGSEGILYPIQLEQSEPVQQHAWAYRIQREGELYVLETLYDAGWFDLYSFTLERQHPIDYVMANHFTCTHPKSPFTHTLLVQRSTPDIRKILLNRHLMIAKAGIREVSRVSDDEELLSVLALEFELSFPSGTRFEFTEKENPFE